MNESLRPGSGIDKRTMQEESHKATEGADGYVRYEKPKRDKIKPISIPSVSFWKNGTLSFNHAAIKAFNISNYSYVLFYYNYERHTIRMDFTTDFEEYSVRIKKSKRTNEQKYTSVQCMGRSFLNYFKIKDLVKAPHNKLPVYEASNKPGILSLSVELRPALAAH